MGVGLQQCTTQTAAAVARGGGAVRRDAAAALPHSGPPLALRDLRRIGNINAAPAGLVIVTVLNMAGHSPTRPFRAARFPRVCWRCRS